MSRVMVSHVTLLDGGMGQELIHRSSRPATPLWSADVMLNEPHLVEEVHFEFVQNGAEVVTLNTYSATPERLTAHNAGDQLVPLHEAAIGAAQRAIARSGCEDVRIAACLPPLVASYRPDLAPPFKESLDSYRRLTELQADASDIVLCETMASLHEARVACTAAKECGKPVWVAFTVSDETAGMLRSGEPLSEAVAMVEELGADAVLINCSEPETVTASWKDLQNTSLQIGAYANGFASVAPLQPGGTVEVLETRHDFTPDSYANHAMKWVNAGANIVGGCCEVSPEHIRVLHQRLKQR